MGKASQEEEPSQCRSVLAQRSGFMQHCIQRFIIHECVLGRYTVYNVRITSHYTCYTLVYNKPLHTVQGVATEGKEMVACSDYKIFLRIRFT